MSEECQGLSTTSIIVNTAARGLISTYDVLFPIFVFIYDKYIFIYIYVILQIYNDKYVILRFYNDKYVMLQNHKHIYVYCKSIMILCVMPQIHDDIFYTANLCYTVKFVLICPNNTLFKVNPAIIELPKYKFIFNYIAFITKAALQLVH